MRIINLTNQYFNLTQLGLIQVSGADAEKFLQGQLTCNVSEVNHQQNRLGANCDQKGRIQATFRLFKNKDDFYILMLQSQITHLLTLLNKYAVFSKVKLMDVSAAWRVIGIITADPKKLFQNVNDENFSPKIDDTFNFNETIVLTIPGYDDTGNPLSRFILINLTEKISAIENKLSTSLTLVSENAWQLLDIYAAIPTIFPETVGEFTPQQINYPAINGVSFKKGCYIGQEIIARMHYLGKTKQRLYRISFINQGAFAPGTKLYANSQQEVGMLVQTARESENFYQGLAVIFDHAISEQIHLDNSVGPILNILKLPYNI